MDNFTLAVLLGDALVIVALIALIVVDKGSPAVILEPLKASAVVRPAVALKPSSPARPAGNSKSAGSPKPSGRR